MLKITKTKDNSTIVTITESYLFNAFAISAFRLLLTVIHFMSVNVLPKSFLRENTILNFDNQRILEALQKNTFNSFHCC